MSFLEKLRNSGPEVIHLDSGIDLEAELRRLNPRRKRRWAMSIPRGKWLIIGLALGGAGACLGILALLQNVILPMFNS